MPVLFKFSGLLLLFLSSASFGFMKSISIRKRAEKLTAVSHSVQALASRIKAEKTEIARAVSLCFSKETVFIENGKTVINKNFLETQDIALLEEFFSSIGLRDINSEYERIILFSSLLEKKGKEAAEKADELCRLYNSLGVLFGIFASIFFL